MATIEYVAPPQCAQYVQLYHEMTGAGMLINGRKLLGNTPTHLAGLEAKMRFRVRRDERAAEPSVRVPT
jgi:hypothetical protein